MTSAPAGPPVAPPPLHLAVALDGAGWHPGGLAGGRRPAERLFTAGYWAELARQAERGLLDFLTIEDGLKLQSDDHFRADDRTDRVRGRLDAVLIAARVAPATRHIGFVPTAIMTHTEPFHLSKAIATLDYVSSGRAGVRVQIAARADEAAHFGRREILAAAAGPRGGPGRAAAIVEHFDEAADYVEVVRRLWDSWEDDAEIRDVATGRFIDRDKLHYIDFEGRWFSVRGPSITPGRRRASRSWRRSATPRAVPTDRTVGRRRLRHSARRGPRRRDRGGGPGRAGPGRPGRTDRARLRRPGGRPRRDRGGRRRAQARLDERAGTEYTSDALIFAGTAAELADLLQEWQAAGLSGFRLRPAALPHDLTYLTERLVPELQRRGLFRAGYEADTLRGLLGLARPANRYAAA